MAVQLIEEVSLRKYQGLSTDTKPTSSVTQGDKFLELDTSIWYTYDGSTWIIRSDRSFGDFGGEFINDTDEVEGKFSAIQVIEDCEITTGGNPTLTSVTLLAGIIIYGKFTSVELASGKVIAYRSGVI